VLDIRVLRRFRSIWFAFSVLLLPAASHAVPFSWTIPSGTETWGTGHVHTILWSGGPAAQVNIYLIHQPSNTVAQTVTLNDVNDGEMFFRLSGTLVPGTYQLYIEDVGPTTWTYGPQFHIETVPSCVAPCVSFATGAPAIVCGQTQADAEALAIALVQSQLNCGMSGTIDPNSIDIETTLLAVGAFPCPSGYSGAYAVEASAQWCCCPRPVESEVAPWSQVKSLYRDPRD